MCNLSKEDAVWLFDWNIRVKQTVYNYELKNQRAEECGSIVMK